MLDVGRRQFITLLGGATVAWPLTARAQQGRLPLVGVLRPNPKDITETFAQPFRRYMRAAGWEEGRNIRFLFVWAEGRSDRAPALAGELVAQNVDLIIAFGDPAIRAAQRATQAIPIVGMTDDMIGSGLAASMARPGGNTTGVSILASELDVKRLEILHEFVPQARRIAVLADPTTISTRAQLASGARNLGVELVQFEAQSPDEIGRALDAITMAKVEAINVLASPILNAARRLIIDRMHDAHLPAIYQWPETSEDGGLLSYGPRNLLCYRHVVSLVDKVLRGAKPADLPIEQPSKFELVVNLIAFRGRDGLAELKVDRHAPRNLAVLHRSMRIAAGMHVLLADGRQRTSLCRAGADPIRDHPVHRLVIGVPRFLL